MTRIQTLLLGLLVTMAIAPAQNCRAADAVPLKVGVTPILPPMIYKENGKITGVEVDFANALGEALGRPVKLVEVEWQDQIPALLEGRTDIIMSDMSITTARQLRIAFAKPYLITGQIALVRRADANRYLLGFPAMPAGTLGVLKATTGDFLVQQEFSNSKRKEYKSGEEAATALKKNRIDLFICDAPTVWWLAGVHEADGLVAVPILLTSEQLAWGVRRSDTDLLNSVNAALDKLQASGRASQIFKRWIPLYQ